MEFDRFRTAAFSGHRSFKIGRQSPDLLDAALAGRLDALVAEGYDTFLCGMAEGFDLLAGRQVLRLRERHPQVRLVAVVPYPGQADRFRPGAAAEYRDILQHADHAVTVCGAYTPDCFHRRNDWMLDRASALVCYYNGSPGGTRYCHDRAVRLGMAVVNLCAQATQASLW